MKRRLHDDEYTTTHHVVAVTDDDYNVYNQLHGVVIEELPKQEEEEYITNFYTRVRAKRRALLNQDDTSLDHSLPSSTSSSELLQYGSSSIRDKEGEYDTMHCNTVAQSVRGGSSFWRNTRHHDTLVDADYYEVDSEEEEEDETVPPSQHQPQQEPDHFRNHHCNGLLRVPCSIVINSESSSIETTSSSLDSPLSSTAASAATAVSAYVDTGATVTIISAAAAKRAGIYHLMDRRYAGRATGVGQCRVLGRIPAHHVSFLLGSGDEKEMKDDDYDVNKNPRSVRGGGLNHYYDKKKKCSNNGNGLVQMDGPALTVIEGTVTKGVDVLLGLDVLQDWEAEIRIGGPIQTMTVREKKTKSTRFNGDEITDTVVIPFATSTTNDGSSRRTSGHGMKKYSGSVGTARDNKEMSTQDHRRRYSNNDKGIEYDSNDNDDCAENDDDPYFSPTLTDIESDLDLLDKLGHEFPHQDVKRTTFIKNRQRNKIDDDIVNDDRDYYLHDDEDDEEKIDMSGL